MACVDTQYVERENHLKRLSQQSSFKGRKNTWKIAMFSGKTPLTSNKRTTDGRLLQPARPWVLLNHWHLQPLKNKWPHVSNWDVAEFPNLRFFFKYKFDIQKKQSILLRLCAYQTRYIDLFFVLGCCSGGEPFLKNREWQIVLRERRCFLFGLDYPRPWTIFSQKIINERLCIPAG